MRFLLVLAILASASVAAEPVVVRDVRYVDTPGDVASAHALDVYAPADPGAGPTPVMVYIHGGGWKGGDKARVGSKAEYFTSRGWAFVSVNYRLLPAGRHPANVDDVAAAIAWVHDHAAEHGIDPDAIFVMGHSAGAHLAALVATNPAPLRKAGKPLGVLKGAIAVDVVDASDRSHREINERIGDPADDRVTGRIEAFLDGVLTRSRAPTSKVAAPITGGDRDAG